LANEIFPFQYKSFGQQISEFGPWFKFPSGQFQFMSDSTEGWLLLSDTLTIGNANSSASYAIEHNFAVYRAIYDNFSNTYAPVNTGRGASALADFDAGKHIRVPYTAARAIANSANGATPAVAGIAAIANGEFFGTDDYTLLLENMPDHTHNPLTSTTSFYGENAGGTTEVNALAGGTPFTTPGTTGLVTSHSGSTTPFSRHQATVGLPLYIKI
jgi:hypothetical protein